MNVLLLPVGNGGGGSRYCGTGGRVLAWIFTSVEAQIVDVVDKEKETSRCLHRYSFMFLRTTQPHIKTPMSYFTPCNEFTNKNLDAC